MIKNFGSDGYIVPGTLKTYEETMKLENEMHKIKYQCTRCKRKKIIPSFRDKSLCKCGYYIFKNKKDEFEYRIKELKRKETKK